MRQKELRIALVCYGGVSLAVYMHGVTKEVWKLARASRDFIGNEPAAAGVEGVYRDLLETIERKHGLRLRVMCDIVAGASAGGLNGVFLAQAIHSGASLEPLTRLWLDTADVDTLIAPEAKRWRFSKLWALPLVWWLLRRPGNVISATVAPGTRAEVRAKLSRLIRSRWFAPPFGGIGFSRLIGRAFGAMQDEPAGSPLLPPGHPLDLFVTATDFKGHLELLRLNSPPLVEESEHRLSLGFHSAIPSRAGVALAPTPELIFAARATASFPGAFPPLQPREIDTLLAEKNEAWPTRDGFLGRIMPEHHRRGDVEGVALIDGSVLNNRPFGQAMAALRDRPAQREVDRRFVYIDPHPDKTGVAGRADPALPGWFSVIFGALSSIPREQPVRDNLEAIERRSHELARLQGIVEALRPEVEATVETLFGRTLFFDRPTVARLGAWRRKAQIAAAERAGFAFAGYAQVKYVGILAALAQQVIGASAKLTPTASDAVEAALSRQLAAQGLTRAGTTTRGQSAEAIDFFRTYDLGFRIRRLRLLARRLTEGWGEADDDVREPVREAVYRAMALYFEREPVASLGRDFPALADRVFEDPGTVLSTIATRQQLAATDLIVDAILVEAMAQVPRSVRRHVLLTYLGFPFYDTVTLPLLQGEGLNEFDPAKVDRISPEDAPSIRSGGAAASLRGTEFYNFGAFFSRAYRENDYLWGRLHGAERMIDLIASALPAGSLLAPAEVAGAKRAAFRAILGEERERLIADPGLVPGIEAEIAAREAGADGSRP